jgi:hypothetical protein
MNHIYVDESIHTRGEFIVIAAVWAGADIASHINEALIECGFQPGRDEFKSSMRMADNEAARHLRERLRFLIFRHCKTAVAVCSLTEREHIIELTARLIEHLPADVVDQPTTIHFDEGMKKVTPSLPWAWKAEMNCNSRAVVGIQLADCAAHTISIMLLSELGIVNKTVSTDSAYPEAEVSMAWELWTAIRYSLSSGKPIGGYDEDGWCDPDMEPFGLLISEDCSKTVRNAAEKRLGSVWVGCIH